VAPSASRAAAARAVVLLTGEPLLVSERLASLQGETVGASPGFGAMDVLFGDRTDLEAMATAIRTIAPGGARLVVVRHAEKLRDEAQRGLLELIDDVPASTRVVIVAESPDMRRALFAGLRERGAVEQLGVGSSRDAAGTRRELIGLVERRATALGLDLDREAREAIVDFVANDPSRLVTELEKLHLRWGTARVGVREALDGLGGERALAAFALEGALRERRIGRAIAELRALLRHGERTEMIVGQLAGEIRSLLRARALLDGGLDEEAAKRAFGGGRGYFVVPRARQFRRVELERALSRLTRIDVAAKTGARGVEARIERWLLEIGPPGTR
jgi:DNA polymerase III subunit delta